MSEEVISNLATEAELKALRNEMLIALDKAVTVMEEQGSRITTLENENSFLLKAFPAQNIEFSNAIQSLNTFRIITAIFMTVALVNLFFLITR